ncbi:MAG: hypothetical protein ACJA08_001283 [Cyclobacteriaceae bacterium]|jgi:hypothetical protein
MLTGLLLLFGCIQMNSEVPDDLLDKEEMAKVMTEIHILEARIYKLYLKQDSGKFLYDHFEGRLLDSLNIPKDQFDRSLDYYFTQDVKGFQKIYEVVVDSLLSRQKLAKD